MGNETSRSGCKNECAGIATTQDVRSEPELASTRLITVLRRIAPGKRVALEAKKRTDAWHSDEFIWEALLLSMATMGNSRGVALVHNERYHQHVTWSALSSLEAEERQLRLEQTLGAAGVRMAKRKAAWLATNFARIQEKGGPNAVKTELESRVGRDAKIEFLDTFAGIGEKYSRNILMDVYHPDFRDSIAIDWRIEKISRALGVTFGSYLEEEQFYLHAAHAAGLNGWELDRLLYWFTDEVLEGLTEIGETSACNERSANTFK